MNALAKTKLTKREEEILLARSKGVTLAQLAFKYKVSIGRISQLAVRAENKRSRANLPFVSPYVDRRVYNALSRLNLKCSEDTIKGTYGATIQEMLFDIRKLIVALEKGFLHPKAYQIRNWGIKSYLNLISFLKVDVPSVITCPCCGQEYQPIIQETKP
jgi:hypothetical protein